MKFEQTGAEAFLKTGTFVKHKQKISNGPHIWIIFQANLAAQFVTARSKSWLSNYMLLLHSATVLDVFLLNFY